MGANIVAYGLGLSQAGEIEDPADYFKSSNFLLVQGLFSVVLISLTLLAMKRREVDLPGLLNPYKKAVLLGIALGMALLPVEHLITFFTRDYLGSSETQRMLLEAASSSPENFLLIFALGAILAPVGEELYFRGYMYSAMRERLGMKKAVLANGLYFGVLHLDFPAFLAIVALGSALAYFYEKKDSLFLVMVSHAFINSTAFAAAYLGYV